ncbi:imv membrane protein, virion morphogenesis [Pteropox virus]|uniref:Imv membrane protein, virion morphogenesis n=1 Tax=Pteropox virus TaxID=1873698 RepID=A0A1B1MRE9_9POXV|nr:imv membrane protein, virion morphogenesis [Pteropox virus]ANS71154.1 imv membrane protein, virion morphogenesis [Pteropox virus]
MDHAQYVLAMFLTDNNSFYSYMADQSDQDALEIVSEITEYLNYLLKLLLQSKQKLEAIGYCYEHLAENFKSVVCFEDMRILKRLVDKTPTSKIDQIKLNKDHLADFVVALHRLKKNMPLDIPLSVTQVNMSQNTFLNNILDILTESENKDNKTKIK